MNIDSKISFFSGFTLTSLWTMPLMEVGMAFLLGLVGGLGGLVGKWIMKKLGWFGQSNK
tara:strand:+ start:702 stop:878 length:177 start_codon:yes stop_codon:yes gene_type:complete